MENLLNIENLSVDFINEKQITNALIDISLKVNKGEIVALVGESGSGKSVTALSVLRLLPSAAKYISGKIYFNNENILSVRSKTIQNIRGNKIAMIFQEPMTSLNPVKSCGIQVSEAIKVHKKYNSFNAYKQTIELFKLVKLPNPKEIFHRFPFQLSGGQKQRVMIAMAMSCSPELLICDEPTTALDVTVQKNILQLIQSLQQKTNMAVIFITHDLGIVAEIADKVMVMYKGKIVEQGNTKEVLLNPQHLYTQALLACRPANHRKGERLPVIADFLENNKSFHENKTMITEKENNPAANETKEIIVRIEDLKIWYPAIKTFTGKILQYNKAVNDVSLHVYKGETLGLVGESGCGKTTLGRALLGLIPVTEGKIYFKNTDITSLHPRALRHLKKDMQIIFQDPYSSLNPRKKIGHSIEEPLLVHKIFSSAKERKSKVIELLEKVNLSADYYNRYPHQFSGGQRQRIVIARALALQPSFIICDESVSALDVSIQAQVLNLLNDLKKEFDFTAIFISHDLSVVRYISDRIVVMNKGRIEESGNAEDIYNNPQKNYTKKLIASIPKTFVS